MSIALITHAACELHDMGRGHPECAERLRAIEQQLKASGVDKLVTRYEAPTVTREQLLRVHTEDYVQSVFDASPQRGYRYFDDDTVLNPHTLPAALHAAGALVLAVDLVMQNQVNSAFCSVRPPGHHATRSRGTGFCFFNNVAVGVAHAMQMYGLERVAIADFDVHHGNGTEDIFQHDERVLLCSTFQHPFYPYCGADTRSTHVVNVPLPAMSNGAAMREAVNHYWLPAMQAFKPQLIFCSAGFDAHADDDMSRLLWQDEDYAWVTTAIKTVATEFCNGRVISTLEGGYDLPSLGRSVVAHIRRLGEL
ncbi:MAG: histone deacetylase family protein [Gammaproteobacteria bacterium]|nr:histone deacetylase family protein [Gammaproteobacteria bacterium]